MLKSVNMFLTYMLILLVIFLFLIMIQIDENFNVINMTCRTSIAKTKH